MRRQIVGLPPGTYSSAQLHAAYARFYTTGVNHVRVDSLGMMMRNYHAFEGDELWDNTETHAELKDAVITILDAFGPDGGIPEPRKGETAGQRRGRSRLQQLSENRTFAEGPNMADDYSLVEIWEGLGLLSKKLEAKK